MPPRFIERLERQSRVTRSVFGDSQWDPPPYASSSKSNSSVSNLSYKSLPAPPPQYYEINSSKGVGYGSAAIPKGSLVLVVGASGWQGVHVVDQLLEYGYRVRGTVRTAEKAVWLSKHFRDIYGVGQFTTVVVPDMVTQGAFNTAIQGCTGVVHCASINSFSPDPTQVITPTIAGALNVLEAASNERNIKRFVYCSSTAAAVSEGTNKHNGATGSSLNMEAFGKAWKPPPYDSERCWDVHAASKLQSEQAVWRWYFDRKPSFVLNVILPGTTWGRLIDHSHHQVPTQAAMLKAIFDGQAATTAWMPARSFVDIQDSALLHVAALILPGIHDQRIFAASSAYNIDSVLGLLRGLYPTKDFGPNVPSHGEDRTRFPTIGQSEELLRSMGKKTWTDIETSVARTCESFF